MKLVRHPVEQIVTGDYVTTRNWSPSSDGKRFEVIDVFADQWLLCLSEAGKRRQFATECVKKLEDA